MVCPVLPTPTTALPVFRREQAPDGSDQYEFLVTALGYNVRTAVQALDKKAMDLVGFRRSGENSWEYHRNIIGIP